MSELKPCPFCGAIAEVIDSKDDNWVMCPNVACRIGIVIEFSRRTWNTRPIEDDLLCRLREVVEEIGGALFTTDAGYKDGLCLAKTIVKKHFPELMEDNDG